MYVNITVYTYTHIDGLVSKRTAGGLEHWMGKLERGQFYCFCFYCSYSLSKNFESFKCSWYYGKQ